MERAYKFAIEELKVSNLSAIKVLRHILENPARAGLSFTRPKSDIRSLADDVYDVITKIKNMYITAASQTQERVAEDAAVVINILHKLAEEGRVAAVLLAKSALVPGTPKELLGVRNSVYMVSGVRRIGYAVPLARFVSLFIRAEEAAEEPME